MHKIPLVVTFMTLFLIALPCTLALILDSPTLVSGNTPIVAVSTATSVTFTLPTGPIQIQGNNTFITYFDSTLSNDGNYTLIATAVENGNIVTATKTITIDNKAPTITINTPTSNNPFFGRAVLIDFTVNDATPTTLVFVLKDQNNNVMVNATQESFSVPANEGNYTIEIIAKDQLNRVASAKCNGCIIIDKTSPAITITQPSSLILTKGKINIAYQTTEPYPENITIVLRDSGNSVAHTSRFTATTQNFEITPSVNEGIYSLEIILTDKSGNTGSVRKENMFYVDYTAPTVTFTLDKTTVNVNEAITASCQATDNSQNQGGNVTVIADPINTNTPGTYKIYCTATDTVGNEKKANYTYVVITQSTNTTTTTTTNTTTTNTTTTSTTNTTTESNTTTTNSTNDSAVTVTFSATQTTLPETVQTIAVEPSTMSIETVVEQAPATTNETLTITAENQTPTNQTSVVEKIKNYKHALAILSGIVVFSIVVIILAIMFKNHPPGKLPDDSEIKRKLSDEDIWSN